MYYLIGKSLKHTMSPYIHSQMNINYEALEIESEEKLLKFLEEKNFLGLNITIPYKETVIKALDYIDEVAKNIGAVNTIVNKNGKLCGYNTDIFGMEYALNYAKIDIKNKNVLILGTGGTAKSAKFVCQKLGANSISFASRQGEINYENCFNTIQDIIINTTPVGMYPNNFDSPIDLTKFNKLSGVFDVIYNPLKTSLIMQTESLNLPCGNGLIMLVAQAVAARNLFINDGKSYSIEDIYHKLWQIKSNIILIGMPGAGKSIIGEKLAKDLGKKFVDTDAEIEKMTNMTITDIFTNKGEEYFRKQEEIAIENALKNTNCIIATGGGAVIREQNRAKIRQSGYVIWLKRDMNALPIANRPLSCNLEKIKELYAQREPYYSTLANISVYNSENEYDKTIAEIRSGYENIGN